MPRFRSKLKLSAFLRKITTFIRVKLKLQLYAIVKHAILPQLH